MALDVLPLKDDGHSHAVCVLDNKKNPSDQCMEGTRKKGKKSKRISLSSIATTNMNVLRRTQQNSKSSSNSRRRKRRRRTIGANFESFGDLTSRDLSLKDLMQKKDASIETIEDLFESVITSSLTEHDSDNESCESGFTALMKRWRTCETGNWEKRSAAGDGDSTNASHPAESYTTESCFEGVLQHWKHMETKKNADASAAATAAVVVVVAEQEDHPGDKTVVGDDGPSAVVPPLVWEDESASRFDFSFDARFDSVLRMPPAVAIRKSPPFADTKKKKKAEKKANKDESDKKKKKKRSENTKKKKMKKRLDTLDDVSESRLENTKKKTLKKRLDALDDVPESLFYISESVLDITETSAITFLEDSPSLADLSKSEKKRKKKKKKNEDASKKKKKKKKRAEMMKTIKTEKKPYASEADADSTESTLEVSESTVDWLEANFDFTQNKLVSLEDGGPTTDAQVAIKAYLPIWLAPKGSRKNSAVEDDTINMVPGVHFGPAKHSAEAQSATDREGNQPFCIGRNLPFP